MASGGPIHHRYCTPLGAALPAAIFLFAAHSTLSPPARAEADAPCGREAVLRTLHRTGRARLEAGDCDAALAAANDILHLAPDDPAGLRLRDDASKAILSRPLPRAKDGERAKRNSQLLLELEREMLLPKPGVVLSAGDLKRLKPPPAPAMEPWERELRRKLERPVAVAFRDTPLGEALARLSALGGIQIVLDPLAAAKAPPVTVARAEMPLGVLLRWVARFARLRCCLRDGAVFFTTDEGMLDHPVQRTYDISGLLAPRRDARRPREPGPVEPVPQARDEARPARDARGPGNGWTQFIRASVAPGTWARPGQPDVMQDRPHYTIAYRNGRIVVVHTPEVHQQIASLLANFRRTLSLQVHILVRYLYIARADLEALNLGTAFDSLDEQPDRHWRVQSSIINDPERGELTRFPDFGAAGGGLSLLYSYLGDNQVSALLQAVKKNRRATLVQAARLTCFNTQRANIQHVISMNYVRRLSSDDEPEIGNIPEGFILDVQPFVSADRRYITLTLQPQVRRLISLSSYRYSSQGEEFVIGPDPTVRGSTIQIPVVQLHSLASTVTIPNGGTLLAAGLTEMEDRHAAAGVPLVEHLPLLGRLFRGTDKLAGRRTLFILVTAQTVPDVFEK